MGQAVIAQVIPERTLGQQPLGIDRPGDAEVRLGVDRQSVGGPGERHAASAEHPGE